ncbi:MAG: ABC transporter permease [Acidobacteriota bacterium]
MSAGRVPNWFLSVLLAAAILFLAEVSAKNGWVSRFILPAPSDVWKALVDGFASGMYWRHIQSTLYPTLGGFALAAVVGILLGGLLASLPRLERVVFPFVVSFQTLPKLAIAPMIVLWLGFGGASKVFIVSSVCFFPVLVNTMQGMRVRNLEFLELARSLGASRLQLFRYIRFPGAIPYIMAGLHIAVIFALIGAVVAEFVGSRSGLGYLMLQQKAAFNIPGAFAVLVLLMALGLLNHGLMVLLEKRVSFWAREVTSISGT